MAVEHLYIFEFKDISSGNTYLGPGTFRKIDEGAFASYWDWSKTPIHFPIEFHKGKGILPEATYADGKTGFIDYRLMAEFDFDSDTQWASLPTLP